MAAGFDAEKLLIAEQRIKEGIDDTKATLATLERYKRDYEVVEKTLRDLPAKVSHTIMVPIGSLAFMPGKLIHTNEITVLLGDNWFAERSASQAADIAVRRIQHVKDQIKSTKTDLTRLTADMKLAEDMRGQGDDDTVNIVEEYHSDEEQQSKHSKATQQPPQRPPAQGSSAVIDASPYLARLKELERLEREAEEATGHSTHQQQQQQYREPTADTPGPIMPVRSPADIFNLMSRAVVNPSTSSSSSSAVPDGIAPPMGMPTRQGVAKDSSKPASEFLPAATISDTEKEKKKHVAFAGTVIEREYNPSQAPTKMAPAVSVEATAVPNTPPARPERVSKFKASRQQAASQ
eukprot:GILJ01004184.1.p1 GENE.GILJ01004184.1~~GILJ01004184.1.p1  ORF type:complete len:367 (-),score=70.17 GILJ01004184.1:83-1129(-)